MFYEQNLKEFLDEWITCKKRRAMPEVYDGFFPAWLSNYGCCSLPFVSFLGSIKIYLVVMPSSRNDVGLQDFILLSKFLIGVFWMTDWLLYLKMSFQLIFYEPIYYFHFQWLLDSPTIFSPLLDKAVIEFQYFASSMKKFYSTVTKLDWLYLSMIMININIYK